MVQALTFIWPINAPEINQPQVTLFHLCNQLLIENVSLQPLAGRVAKNSSSYRKSLHPVTVGSGRKTLF